MKEIFISVSLQGGAGYKEIEMAIETFIPHGLGVVLNHGHMNHAEVKRRGLDTGFLCLLDQKFPYQNIWSVGCRDWGGNDWDAMREKMADYASLHECEVYVIGDIIGGVKTEVDLFKAVGCDVRQVGRNPNGTITIMRL